MVTVICNRILYFIDLYRNRLEYLKHICRPQIREREAKSTFTNGRSNNWNSIHILDFRTIKHIRATHIFIPSDQMVMRWPGHSMCAPFCVGTWLDTRCYSLRCNIWRSHGYGLDVNVGSVWVNIRKRKCRKKCSFIAFAKYEPTCTNVISWNFMNRMTVRLTVVYGTDRSFGGGFKKYILIGWIIKLKRGWRGFSVEK